MDLGTFSETLHDVSNGGTNLVWLWADESNYLHNRVRGTIYDDVLNNNGAQVICVDSGRLQKESRLHLEIRPAG